MISTNTREHTAAGSTPHGGVEDGPGHEDQNMMWTEREGPLALAHRHAPAHMWNVSGAHSGGEQREMTRRP